MGVGRAARVEPRNLVESGVLDPSDVGQSRYLSISADFPDGSPSRTVMFSFSVHLYVSTTSELEPDGDRVAVSGRVICAGVGLGRTGLRLSSAGAGGCRAGVHAEFRGNVGLGAEQLR